MKKLMDFGAGILISVKVITSKMKTVIECNGVTINPDEFTAEEKIVAAFRKMNIRPFEKLLTEDLQWAHDKNKYDLIARIKTQFENLRAAGNTELIPVFGQCAGACGKKSGYRFEGNKTHSSITYIISEDAKGQLELTYCISFQVPGEPAPDPF